MRFFSVVAALAIASSVAATGELKCPPLARTQNCAPPPHLESALHGPGKKHPKPPVTASSGSGKSNQNKPPVPSHLKGSHLKGTPASDTTSAKIRGVRGSARDFEPGPVSSPTLLIDAGVYAMVNVKTGAFLGINLVNGSTFATLTNVPTLVTVSAVELEGGDVSSLVISASADITTGLHLAGLLDVDARLQLSVGGVAGSEPTCSRKSARPVYTKLQAENVFPFNTAYFRAVSCGAKLKDDKRMVKRSVTDDVLGLAADVVANVALKIGAVADIVVPGIGKIAASVCLIAEASVDAEVLALTSINKGALELGLNAFVDAEASTFIMLKIDRFTFEHALVFAPHRYPLYIGSPILYFGFSYAFLDLFLVMGL
ncbi:BQ2448_3349 [Microbotryum intermedium]|uniref:BQ2448_3349 protein n=1 Tax=Microbotryum intermedium TaxID=269621 RepID=A0A238FBQ0_9BASI|nr:BQ2448_3349 [Microbotryum intermedium]